MWPPIFTVGISPRATAFLRVEVATPIISAASEAVNVTRLVLLTMGFAALFFRVELGVFVVGVGFVLVFMLVRFDPIR